MDNGCLAALLWPFTSVVRIQKRVNHRFKHTVREWRPNLSARARDLLIRQEELRLDHLEQQCRCCVCRLPGRAVEGRRKKDGGLTKVDYDDTEFLSYRFGTRVRGYLCETCTDIAVRVKQRVRDAEAARRAAIRDSGEAPAEGWVLDALRAVRCDICRRELCAVYHTKYNEFLCDRCRKIRKKRKRCVDLFGPLPQRLRLLLAMHMRDVRPRESVVVDSTFEQATTLFEQQHIDLFEFSAAPDPRLSSRRPVTFSRAAGLEGAPALAAQPLQDEAAASSTSSGSSQNSDDENSDAEAPVRPLAGLFQALQRRSSSTCNGKDDDDDDDNVDQAPEHVQARAAAECAPAAKPAHQRRVRQRLHRTALTLFEGRRVVTRGDLFEVCWPGDRLDAPLGGDGTEFAQPTDMKGTAPAVPARDDMPSVDAPSGISGSGGSESVSSGGLSHLPADSPVDSPVDSPLRRDETVPGFEAALSPGASDKGVTGAGGSPGSDGSDPHAVEPLEPLEPLVEVVPESLGLVPCDADISPGESGDVVQETSGHLVFV